MLILGLTFGDIGSGANVTASTLYGDFEAAAVVAGVGIMVVGLAALFDGFAAR
ncbi:MAG: hypothetical protein ACREDE_07375 [Thermoplasmata archaeon]